MLRWILRLNGWFILIPAVCVLAYSMLFTAFSLLTVPQLPAWSQEPAMAWVVGESALFSDGSPPDPQVPPGGYDGPMSFLCLLPPEIGYLTDPFGTLRPGGWIHRGIDYGTYGLNVPVRTPLGGKVVFAGWGGAYGNLVIIESGGFRVYLAHLESFSILPEMVVAAGDEIGFSGSSGNSSGIHVHFEIRAWNDTAWTAVDPNLIRLPGQTEPCSWDTLSASAW